MNLRDFIIKLFTQNVERDFYRQPHIKKKVKEIHDGLEDAKQMLDAYIEKYGDKNKNLDKGLKKVKPKQNKSKSSKFVYDTAKGLKKITKK